MADLFRDSSFGQILRLYFKREITPYEDERPGFRLKKTIARSVSENGGSRHTTSTTTIKPEQLPRRNTFDRNWNNNRNSDSNSTEEEFGVFFDRSWRKPTSKLPKSVNVSIRQKDSNRNRNKTNIIGFIGPEDQDSPRNWSTFKKVFTFSQICLLTFAVYSGSAIMAPATTTFLTEFGQTPQTASLTLSLYVLGYGLGPLLFSPLSEVPDIGRNLSYMSSFLIYIGVTAGGAWVNNFPAFVALRFLQGFFGGPVLATGGASAQDLFDMHKLPYGMAAWSLFAFAGPAGGPVASGFAVSLSSWRWGMWETLILSGATYVLLFFCLPETNSEYILTQRTKRLRVRFPDANLKTQAEVDGEGRDWSKIIPYHLTMPFKITALDPSVLFINIYIALVYSIYYSFFESFPIVYTETYGFSIGISSLVYLSVLIGGLIALVIYCTVIRIVYEPYTLKHGVGDPEWRLFPGVCSAVLQPIGLFIFAFASKRDITWVAPTVGIVLYLGSAYTLMNSISVYLPLSYPRYAASVFAANGFFRSAMACTAIHYAHPLFDHLGVGNGCAILGSINALLALLFLGLYRYGGDLRARSTFAD